MVARTGRVGERYFLRLQLAVEYRCGSNFGPVVIFGLDPEDRDNRDAMLSRGSARQLNRGDGFEDRIERPAERAGLLPGDNRHRIVVGKQGGGGECFWGSTASHELLVQ